MLCRNPKNDAIRRRRVWRRFGARQSSINRQPWAPIPVAKARQGANQSRHWRCRQCPTVVVNQPARCLYCKYGLVKIVRGVSPTARASSSRCCRTIQWVHSSRWRCGLHNPLIHSTQNKQIDTTFIEQSSSTSSSSCRRHSLNVEHGGDSGIDSVQASPSPITQQSNQPIIITSSSTLKQSSSSPTPSERQQQRKLLHPDHARIIRPPTSPDNVSLETTAERPIILWNPF